MTTKIVTSFEVLARPIAPLVPDVPYVQQGAFIQISNLNTKSVTLSIEYEDTPAFLADKGAIKLFTDFIDHTGAATIYNDTTFLAAPVGFKGIKIPAKATWLFGVQYLLLPPPPAIVNPATGSTPQDTLEARGVIHIKAPAGSNLLVLATIRQVFNNFDPAGALLDVAEGAYSTPIVGGPHLVF